ncbi:hypothetical protein DSO57_1004721 [Entomophthora muscae]|uniref:Uncharacterized protein n=1 Tax=Entomophthora muscae TaxID=34485 RepID=A0ACC2SXD9_9FUNG|nr:hypothetical protein DSO57_1004721 [Entomophthora muscae]
MLPYYFLPDIFKYLEHKDQCQLRLVCKEWNRFLLPFVFSRLSTYIYEGFEELLRKYGEFVRELHIGELNYNIIDLIFACKNTTRLIIDFHFIYLGSALILGKEFPHLSCLELFDASPADIRHLSPLTRKMKTLSYYPEACEDPEDFVTHYKDFDCPLVTHLIIVNLYTFSHHDFLRIIKIFPALKTLDYAGPNSSGFQFTHFVYDVENMVFKEKMLFKQRFVLECSFALPRRYSFKNTSAFIGPRSYPRVTV